MKQLFLTITLSLCFLPASGFTADWPMWRYDANRSAASPEALPDTLHLQWVREYPQPDPVWDDPLNQDLMQFDTYYEPIVLGDTVFIGFNDLDCLNAFDLQTGEEKWTYFTDGPVRLPAVAQDDLVYFASDDGTLYCLNVDDGALVWKHHGVVKERLIIGNERLISTWPMRGGPVIKDDVVYFATGIWPFMGVFIYAVDAKTGEEIWVNDSSSAPYIKQPHNSPSFAGVAPQGSLVIEGDKLLIPGGRSVPACFDLNTGEFLYYELAASGKTGGAFTTAQGDFFVNYHRDRETSLYSIHNGSRILSRFADMPVMTPEHIFSAANPLTAYDYANFKQVEKVALEKDNDTGEIKLVTKKEWDLPKLWELDVAAKGDLIKAGNRLYAGDGNTITVIDLSSDEPSVLNSYTVEGEVKRLIAANNKLIAVTLEGKIYCFGEEEGEVQEHPYTTIAFGMTPTAANHIVELSGITEGYTVLYGVDDLNLAAGLMQQSNMFVIGVDQDADKINQLREQSANAGIHGKHLSFKIGNIEQINMPPYFANLVVIQEDALPQASVPVVKKLFEQLRPYGGTAVFQVSTSVREQWVNTIHQANLVNAKVTFTDDGFMLSREGALPGADDWTHQYGNIANTIKSDDKRVKLPLGLLWYGGSSNMDVLPRHGHGPPEQVVDGRLFIQGMSSLSARDVYTGTVLWKREFDDLGNYGVYFDDTYKDTPLDTAYNQIHIPGANARGTNYVVTQDVVYLIKGDTCLMIDPVTGEDKGTISLPELEDDTPKSADWGYIGVYEDYLVAGAGMVSYMDFIDLPDNIRDKSKPFMNFDNTTSKHLVVMNRYTGEVHWTKSSELGFRHNAICVGNDTLFCIDRMPDPVIESLKRRGYEDHGTPRLIAIDIHSGEERWQYDDNVFGTWLGYSEEHNLLLQSGRPSRDMLAHEPYRGMSTFNADTGDKVWTNEARYSGPNILHKDLIIAAPHAYNLLTGEQIARKNPLTGGEEPWAFDRQYGCNYAVASESLLTFRSAAAGFYDLDSDGGTGNFGGFKSGCTANLIAANGVLNAPDYTRTCSCPYQNQTSLALIHEPSVETWTYNDISLGEGRISQLGINFGAPGDRRTPNGTLWLEFPISGGPSPEIPLLIEPESAEYYLHHTLRVNGDALPWVSASGIRGAETITLTVDEDATTQQSYTVRLFFMEPQSLDKGERVFDVSLQGEIVLDDFDIAAETSLPRESLVKEFNNVMIGEALQIQLDSLTDDYPALLSGVEIITSQIAVN